MKIKLALNILLIFIIISCDKNEKLSSIDKENWEKRRCNIDEIDSMLFGRSYLSVYSQIYSITEHKTHDLTSMVSMRNTSCLDTIYILKAEYYGTKGNFIRQYFDFPIYLAPLETTEIVIDQVDISGGTGSNFIFEWKIPKNCSEPLFEGVMTSTRGQQGLSFTTQSKRIN